jgi:hypothetical protein
MAYLTVLLIRKGIPHLSGLISLYNNQINTLSILMKKMNIPSSKKAERLYKEIRAFRLWADKYYPDRSEENLTAML